MAASLSHGVVAVGRWARKEFNALWPVFVFFLVGFLLLILLLKAALAEFSIEVRVISNAVIGRCWPPRRRSYLRRRRWDAVL